jgi:uncharacterized protein YjbI with pentapeptide repeats
MPRTGSSGVENLRPLTRDDLQAICDKRRSQVRRTSDDTPFRDSIAVEAQATNGKPGPLAGMDWSGEDFTGCDLRGADLSHCCFDSADFGNADLWDADLRESDLRGALHLLPAQLAATDLLGAQLPESVAEFDTLKMVEALSVSSAKVFFTLLLAVVYVVLTAGTVRDAYLITDAHSLKLPVIDVTISGSYFFIIAPLLLLCLFVYFHLYLQRLWEALAQLPARFPDGRRLDERTPPWLMNDLGRQHIPLLARMGIPLAFLQAFLSISIGYLLVPVAIGELWHRYLPMQNSAIAVFQIVLFALAVAGAAHFGRLKYDAFARKPLRRSWLARVVRAAGAAYGLPAGALAATGIGFITLGVLETGANAGIRTLHTAEVEPLIGSSLNGANRIVRPDGPLPWWKPEALVSAAVSVARRVPARDHAEVVAEDVSTKPSGWTDVETRRAEEMGQVRPVVFFRTRFCRLQAQSCFLAKAVFAGGADLRWANFTLADLRGAMFYSVTADDASLAGARFNDEIKLPENNREVVRQGYPVKIRSSSFRRANLSSAEAGFMDVWLTDFNGADFSYAHCVHARFIKCKLAGANFSYADCRKAMFGWAGMFKMAPAAFRSDLKGANFINARLDGADLSGTNLLEAKGLTVEQLRSAKTIYHAQLDPPLAKELAKELETLPPREVAEAAE